MNQLEFSGGSESCEREDACRMIKKTNERTNRNEFCTLLLQLQECYLSASYSFFFIFSRSRLKLKHETKLQKVKFKNLSLQCD